MWCRYCHLKLHRIYYKKHLLNCRKGKWRARRRCIYCGGPMTYVKHNVLIKKYCSPSCVSKHYHELNPDATHVYNLTDIQKHNGLIAVHWKRY
jgi:hypothetical protein